MLKGPTVQIGDVSLIDKNQDFQGETSKALRRAIEAISDDQPTLGDLVDALGRTGHGLMLLLLALPAFIPVPALPTGLVFGVALSLVAIQMIAGREALTLPGWLRKRSLPRGALVSILEKLDALMARLHGLLRPRLPALTRRAATVMVAALVLLMGMTLLLPIPFGNQGPAFAVVVFAFGLLEKDGVAILAGMALSVVGVLWNVMLVVFGAELTRMAASFLS